MPASEAGLECHYGGNPRKSQTEIGCIELYRRNRLYSSRRLIAAWVTTSPLPRLDGNVQLSEFTTNPSSALPPPDAPLPRSRGEILANFSSASGAEALTTNVFETQQRLILEVLLDIRDLQAECAWRLSDAMVTDALSSSQKMTPDIRLPPQKKFV